MPDSVGIIDVPALRNETIRDLLQRTLRYGEKMRDEYAGRPGVYAELHAKWVAYIAEMRQRITALYGSVD